MMSTCRIGRREPTIVLTGHRISSKITNTRCCIEENSNDQIKTLQAIRLSRLNKIKGCESCLTRKLFEFL